MLERTISILRASVQAKLDSRAADEDNAFAYASMLHNGRPVVRAVSIAAVRPSDSLSPLERSRRIAVYSARAAAGQPLFERSETEILANNLIAAAEDMGRRLPLGRCCQFAIRADGSILALR